jgi:uncharacterized protein YkwD
MRRTLILFLGAVLALGVLVDRPGPVAATASDDLYAAITTYRQGLGLAAIPLSPQLTAVAQAHVRDLMANFATDPNYTGAGCVPHGWSSQGQWTGGCYKFEDPTTFPIMWNKPKEIANYPGNGFEIVFGGGGGAVTAAEALQAWQDDPPHNDVIVNQGIWKDHPWQAIGVWVEDGWASVWFGEQADPNGTQPATTQNGQPAGTNDTGNGNGGTVNIRDLQTNPTADTPPSCLDAEESAFLTLINDYRAANGVGPLALSATLSAAADAHSQDMATNDFLGHTGSDGSSFGQRFVAHGYTNTGAGGENVFAGDATAAGAFDAWRNSPPHNANMLSPDFKAIGVGRVNNPNSMFGWYWTTTFGVAVDAAGCLDGGQQNGQPADTNGAGGGGDAGTTDGGAATNGGNNGAGTHGDAAGAAACVDGEELAFLTLINDYRAANGVGPLTLSPTLSAAAKAHSQDMATKNYFDHTGLDGSTPEQRMTAAGYTGANATGENIFAGDEKASGAFASWQNSPPHNANMLSPNFTAIGIGRAFEAGSQFGWYWTTTFGDKVDAACGGPEATGQPTDAGTGGTGQTDQTGTGDNTTDTDGDGLLDEDEINVYGTDPQTFDGDEVFNGTDPSDPSDDNGGNANGGSDRDGDGLLDDDETNFFGTNPDAFDTDGDGVGDGDEVFNGTDPLDPGSF